MVPHRSWFPRLSLVAASLALGVAYTVRPLFESNQNHKFLIGLARAGYGSLSRDWLVETADPIPAFSAIVEATYAVFGPWFYYLDFLLLLIPYLAGLLAIFEVLGGGRSTASLRLVFVTAMVGLHSALLGDVMSHVFQVDLRDLLVDGVAMQTLLDHYFQPSCFGVFLLLSVARMAQGKPRQSVLFAAIPPGLHFTYLPTAAVLLVTYLSLLAWDDRGVTRRVGTLAMLFGAITLPTIVYTALTFGPSEPETFRQAQHILAATRIPHHCDATLWFDGMAVARLSWIVFGLLLAWGTRLFTIMAVSLAVSVSLTVVQVATGSEPLALLFPWRASTLLVPLATAVVVGRAVWMLFDTVADLNPRARSSLRLVLVILITQCALYGAISTWDRVDHGEPVEFREMTAFVRDHRTPQQTFVIPIERGPGVMEKFRIATGVPVYVDFKSHPYKDSEVLEWSRRISLCESIYRDLWRCGTINGEAVAALRKAGATHLLWDGPAPSTLGEKVLVYRNDRFMIIDLEPLLTGAEPTR